MNYASWASSSELELAKAILERRIGYGVFRRTFCDVVPHGNLGAILKHTPVIRLLSVQARANHIYDLFGQTDWIDIPLEQAVLHQKDGRAVVTLPPTLFGTSYAEAKITYEAGLINVPPDIEKAVQMIAEGLHTGEIDPETGVLPVEVLEVISRHRKGA